MGKHKSAVSAQQTKDSVYTPKLSAIFSSVPSQFLADEISEVCVEKHCMCVHGVSEKNKFKREL